MHRRLIPLIIIGLLLLVEFSLELKLLLAMPELKTAPSTFLQSPQKVVPSKVAITGAKDYQQYLASIKPSLNNPFTNPAEIKEETAEPASGMPELQAIIMGKSFKAAIFDTGTRKLGDKVGNQTIKNIQKNFVEIVDKSGKVTKLYPK